MLLTISIADGSFTFNGAQQTLNEIEIFSLAVWCPAKLVAANATDRDLFKPFNRCA